MAVVHAALDAQGEVRFGVWLGTATSLEGLYRAEAQASSLPWAEVRHPPYLDYKRDDEPEYDTSGWPACTEVGTWADWVRWTIWKQPGYLDVWIEVEPEPTVQELFAREFAGREAGPVIRLTEVERP
jgi:hypothetical protein